MRRGPNRHARRRADSAWRAEGVAHAIQPGRGLVQIHLAEQDTAPVPQAAHSSYIVGRPKGKTRAAVVAGMPTTPMWSSTVNDDIGNQKAVLSPPVRFTMTNA